MDDPSDLSCTDCPHQLSVDDPLLSCKQWLGAMVAVIRHAGGGGRGD